MVAADPSAATTLARVTSATVTEVRSFLLDALGAPERDALVARLRPREYKRGQVVFNDGDRGDCLHLVQSGHLDVQITTLLGQTMTLRVVQPGEFFGELALVHPDTRRMGRVRRVGADLDLDPASQRFRGATPATPGC